MRLNSHLGEFEVARPHARRVAAAPARSSCGRKSRVAAPAGTDRWSVVSRDAVTATKATVSEFEHVAREQRRPKPASVRGPVCWG